MVPFLHESVRVDSDVVLDFLGQGSVRLFKHISDIVTVFAG